MICYWVLNSVGDSIAETYKYKSTTSNRYTIRLYTVQNCKAANTHSIIPLILLTISSPEHCCDYRSVAATVVEMMTAERPYKSNSNIKDNNAIVYMVGMDKLNPLQSVSMKKLVDDGVISHEAITFLRECFKT